MTTYFRPNYLWIPLIMLTFSGYAQSTSSTNLQITPQELEIALGDWTGSLTYIDYQSNKPYTMPANLEVKPGKNSRELILHRIYPNEPKANGKGKIKISEDGLMLNKEAVVAKEVLTDGIKIITEYSGKDNNQKAQIRNTYILQARSLVIRKEVQFEDSEDWLKRSEFTHTK